MNKPDQARLEAMFRGCMGENMHTAFRKAGDCAEAVEIWNLIQKMPDAEWSKIAGWMAWALAYSLHTKLELKK